MALAPADFYAYSRATGVPVPENPEERAALAPEVLEFRRNQLKGPESEGVDPLSVGIGLGLAAAGAGAGAYGIRSLLKGRDLPKQEGKGGAKFVDLEEVTKYDVDELQRKQANVAPPPSKEPTSPIPRTTIVPGPKQLSSARPDVNEFLMSQIGKQPDDLTSFQRYQLNDISRQSFEAVDTGLDQQTARATTRADQRDVETIRAGFGSRQARLMQEFGQLGAASTNLDDTSAAQQRAAYQAQEALAVQKSKAPRTAKALQTLGPQYGLSQEEIFHRITASASDYRPGSMTPLSELDVAALLDPTVPTKAVSDLLGTTLAVRGGRVGRNLDYEVMAEGAGMTERGSAVEIVGDTGSDAYAYNPTTGNFELDTNADLEDLNLRGGRTSDYDNNAADYGDVEGPGGFVSTKGFEERTKSGKTIIPGVASEAEGLAPGSLRQEREVDRVIPARETVEGDPAAGWTFDPRTGRPVLVGAGKRLEETRTNLAGKPIKVVQVVRRQKELANAPGNPTVTVQVAGPTREQGAYQGPISVDDPSYDPTSGGKYSGRLQPATAEVSPFINTQPIVDFKEPQERVIQDAKGRWWVDDSKTKKVGETQLRGRVGSDPNLRDISLDRREINSVLSKAADQWNVINAKGELGALERQQHLIDSLNGYLVTQKQISLPVLQRDKRGRLPSEAYKFINDITPGTKESNIYGRPAKVNADNKPMMIRDSKDRVTLLVDPEYQNMKSVPIPGFTRISGTGGVAVQEVDADAYEGDISFFSPTTETAPQVVRNRKTGEVLSASQSAQGAMGQLSTGEVVPQQVATPTLQFQIGSPYQQKTIQRSGSEYVATDFSPLNFLLPAGPPASASTTYRGYSPRRQSTSSNVGTQLVSLRSALETPQTGEGISQIPIINQNTGEMVGFSPVSDIRIGSFARTQNPYTGVAAPAMGPASRALTGDYQYRPEQLTVSFQAPDVSEASTYTPGSANVESMMQRSLAQAGRRAAKRRRR